MNSEARVRALRRIGTTALVMTVLLMMLGGWVKATGSGLACPDWPACYGKWVPPFPSQENGGLQPGFDPANDVADRYTQAQVMYEWTHRAVAVLLGIPILLFAILSIFGRDLSTPLRILPTAAVGVLVIQAGLGGATVIHGNPAFLTTAHLTTATLFLVLITIATTVAYTAPLRPAPPSPAPEERPEPKRFEGYTYTDVGERVGE